MQATTGAPKWHAYGSFMQPSAAVVIHHPFETSLLVGGALTAGGLYIGQRGVRWARHGKPPHAHNCHIRPTALARDSHDACAGIRATIDTAIQWVQPSDSHDYMYSVRRGFLEEQNMEPVVVRHAQKVPFDAHTHY